MYNLLLYLYITLVAYFFARTMSIFHHVPILMETYFQKLGLSKGRFLVMIQLLRAPGQEGMSITDIIAFHKVSSATMTGKPMKKQQTRKATTKTAPPLSPVMYGKRQMAPNPTAEPAPARMKPVLELQAPRLATNLLLWDVSGQAT